MPVRSGGWRPGYRKKPVVASHRYRAAGAPSHLICVEKSVRPGDCRYQSACVDRQDCALRHTDFSACTLCKGLGQIDITRMLTGAVNPRMTTCPNCKGQGRVPEAWITKPRHKKKAEPDA